MGCSLGRSLHLPPYKCGGMCQCSGDEVCNFMNDLHEPAVYRRRIRHRWPNQPESQCVIMGALPQPDGRVLSFLLDSASASAMHTATHTLRTLCGAHDPCRSIDQGSVADAKLSLSEDNYCLDSQNSVTDPHTIQKSRFFLDPFAPSLPPSSHHAFISLLTAPDSSRYLGNSRR